MPVYLFVFLDDDDAEPHHKASLDSNLFRFQIDGVVAMVLLHGLGSDIAPFVENVGGIIF